MLVPLGGRTMHFVRTMLDIVLVGATAATIFQRLGYFDWFATCAAALQAAGSLPHMKAQARSILDDLEKIFQILAYIVGALWVYFNFLRGRTYRERLEPAVFGYLSRDSDPEMIRAVVRAKNVGLTKVDVQQSGSGLRFLAWDASRSDNWRHLATQSVFERHGWIEPGETVEDHLILPAQLRGVPAVKLELVLTSGKIMWNSVAIVT